MSTPLPQSPSDSPTFIQTIQSLINAAAALESAQSVRIIRIDNWFDHKWLYFSGKSLGAIGLHKRRITIPPFHPNRVENETLYQWNAAASHYQQTDIKQSIHIKQWSSENFQRLAPRILGENAVAAWFSSRSAQDARGSLMVYSTRGEPSAWFASFAEDQSWTPHKLKHISREQINHLLHAANHPLQDESNPTSELPQS